MNCPLCGEDCRCQPQTPVSPRWIADVESDSMPQPQLVPAPAEILDTQNVSDGAQDCTGNAEAAGSNDQNSTAWRDELATRLHRYRARHKPRPPRYPSLCLRFDPPSSNNSEDAEFPARIYETSSNQALALDSMTEVPADPAFADVSDEGRSGMQSTESFSIGAPGNYPPTNLSAKSLAAKIISGKIIEFPRHAGLAPPVPLDELAEPVMVRPRILEVPDIAPPLPALGGITIEAAEQKEIEKRLGIDIPLQSAPLGRRIGAAVIDGLIVAAASMLFGGIFWKVTAFRPPQLQLLVLAVGIPYLFWACYQYLLIVYSAATPGLRLAGLELTRFNGASTNRRTRRWRVLASYLSALSLGMGYLWLFLDEDALCWHDRITHTYLARKSPAGKLVDKNN